MRLNQWVAVLMGCLVCGCWVTDEDRSAWEQGESWDWFGGGGSETGELPDDNTSSHSTWVQVIAGGWHSCGLDDEGKVHCWGCGGVDYGQCEAPSGTFEFIDTYDTFNCGLRSNGSIECWGEDINGTLSVPAGSYEALAVGEDFGCALDESGRVDCWGISKPLNYWNSQKNWAQSIGAGGGEVTCIVTIDGSLECWCHPEDLYSNCPPPEGLYSQVDAGGQFACAIDDSDSIVCWGRDHYDQASPPAGAFEQISLNNVDGCGIRTSGEIACWPDGTNPPSGTYTQVATGTSHWCALTDDGRINCWGSNSSGQATPP